MSARDLKPSLEHTCPGGVKIHDGNRDLYHQPITTLCVNQGCKVYSWDDAQEDGFWIQHGENEESSRFFLNLTPPIPLDWMVGYRPTIFHWVIECHAYAEFGAAALT